MNIIDLTHAMEQGLPCFHADWHTAFSSETLGTIESVGRNTKKLTLGSHTGTHMDAPRHFIPDGITITDPDMFPIHCYKLHPDMKEFMDPRNTDGSGTEPEFELTIHADRQDTLII